MTQTIQNESDIYIALRKIKYYIKDLPFTHIDVQSISVCLMEAARNVLDHGGGRGMVVCHKLTNSICITVIDDGPGIPNLDEILSGRFTSSKGLGLGLSGIMRLMDDVTIETSSKGTKIIAIKRYA